MQIIHNFSWALGGVALTRLFSPLFSIAIARFLSPDQFGVFTLAMTIISSMDFLKELGLSDSIIASSLKNTKEKLNTQFTYQFVIALLLFSLIQLFASSISDFFNEPRLIYSLRILSLVLLTRAFSDPIMTYLIKEKNFKVLFYRSIIPSSSYGIVALVLLQYDYGETALAIGFLTGEILLLLFFQLKNTTKYVFAKDSFSLLPFGYKIVLQRMSSGLLLSNVSSLLLGFFYSVNEFGYYKMSRNLAVQLPNAFLKESSNVVFSEISSRRDDQNYSKRIYFLFGICGSICLQFLSTLLVFAMPFLVPFILGGKWVDTIVLLQLFCLLIPSFQIRNTQLVYLKVINEMNMITKSLFVYSILLLLSVLFAANSNLEITLVIKLIIFFDSLFTLFHWYIFRSKIFISHKLEPVFYGLFLCQVVLGLIFLV